MGGPAHWLEKLLEMAPEKKFILEMAQRKVQVLLQVCVGGRACVCACVESTARGGAPGYADCAIVRLCGVRETSKDKYTATRVHLLSAFLRAKGPIDKRERSEFPQ